MRRLMFAALALAAWLTGPVPSEARAQSLPPENAYVPLMPYTGDLNAQVGTWILLTTEDTGAGNRSGFVKYCVVNNAPVFYYKKQTGDPTGAWLDENITEGDANVSELYWRSAASKFQFPFQPPFWMYDRATNSAVLGKDIFGQYNIHTSGWLHTQFQKSTDPGPFVPATGPAAGDLF